MVITAFMGLFISAINEQRRNADRVNLLNNGSYAIEYMTRAIRMAEKNVSLPIDNCVGDKMNYRDPIGGGQSIQFLKTEWDPITSVYVQRCQCFFWDNVAKKIKSARSSNAGMNCDQNVEDLTPADILVENLQFAVQGDGQADDFQPVATLTIKIKSTGSEPQELEFQASVSQRQLDISY